MIDFLHKDLFGDFHLIRPIFLWALAPIFLVILLFLFSLKEEIKWKKNIPVHLRPFMIIKGNQTKEIIWKIILFITLISGVFGLAGPTWKKIEIPGKTLETPLVLILDLSQSMMATDIQPNRLERAKFKITDLIKANPGARMALVGFAGTAHVILPLTNDYSLIESHINQLSPSIMPYYGSDLEAGIDKAFELSSVTKAPATFIILSDDFDESTFEMLKNKTQDSLVRLEIIPFNSFAGSEIPYGRYKTSLKDKSSKVVHSKLNQEVLNKLHSLENISVNYLTLDTSDVKKIAKSINENLKFRDKAEEKEDDWEDRGLLFIIPFAFMIAVYFRKGMSFYTILILFSLSSCSKNDNFIDLWYSKDYQGQLASNKSSYYEAASLYENPLRKGVAYFKAENYEEAIRYFSKDTTAQGMYNLGISYYKNGDYAAAALAFGKTVELDPTIQNAAKNKLLAEHLSGGTSETANDVVLDKENKEAAKNEQNKSPEDLSGGGQEATEKDMQKKRLEETTNTDIRKGKELDELPDDFELGKIENSPKLLMQKVDDDPSLFLKRKFLHQVKKEQIKPKSNRTRW